jgi:hypothetical protein
MTKIIKKTVIKMLTDHKQYSLAIVTPNYFPFVWNWKVHRRVYKSLLLSLILIYINPVPVLSYPVFF